MKPPGMSNQNLQPYGDSRFFHRRSSYLPLCTARSPAGGWSPWLAHFYNIQTTTEEKQGDNRAVVETSLFCISLLRPIAGQTVPLTEEEMELWLEVLAPT